VFSGYVRRKVFVFLLLVCLVRTGTRQISCKCLLEDFEGVVAGDLRTDTEVEGTVKALSVEELDSDICSSVWFLNRENSYFEIDPCLVEKFQLSRSQRWHFYL
jgi:hypothetical protein